MKKHRWTIFFIFGFLLLLIFLISYDFIMEGKSSKNMINVSVLLYGKDAERWTSLKQGAEQAAKDYNVVINYVTTSTEDAPKEQMDQMNREISNKTRGFLIAACDSTLLEEPVAEHILDIPIIMIESGVNHVESANYLSANNYEMGKTLAKTIMKDGIVKKKVAVISAHMQRDSVALRIKGFTDSLKGYDIVSLGNSGVFMDQAYFKQELTDNNIDTIVALDNGSLENLVDVIEAANLKVTVYGIGNTDNVVYHLDKGVIQSIVFQDEFSIGYLGIQKLYQKIENAGKDKNPLITFRVIDRDHMYTSENQRLLFPLVQ